MDFQISEDDVIPVLLKLLAIKGIAVSSARVAGQYEVNIHSEQELLQYVQLTMDKTMDNARAKVIHDGELSTSGGPYLAFCTTKRQCLLVSAVRADGMLAFEDHEGEEGTDHIDQHENYIFIGFDFEAEGASGKNKEITAFDLFREQIFLNRRVILEAIFTTLVISFIGLITALYTMQVYDRVVPTKGYSTLWVLTIGVGIAILSEFTLKLARSHMVDYAAREIDLNLGKTFFARALDIRLDARPPTVGTFASQVRHFESVRGFMTASTLFVLADLPFAIVFICVIFLIAGPVAIVPMITIPVAIGLGWLFRTPIEKASQKHMAESSMKNGLMIEAIDGIETLKSVGSEWVAVNKFQELNKVISKSELHLRLLSTKASNLTQVIQQCNYVALIATGAYLITSGSLTMGGLIACSIISGRALSPLAQIPGMLVQWKQARIALNGLNQIMMMPTDDDNGARQVIPGQCDGNIKAHRLQFTYNQENSVIDVKDLEIKSGERVAIVGPVGSGKSTLMKLLSGLYRPSQGQVCLDGVDMSVIAPEYLREKVVYLPQDVRLFNGSLRDNLLLGVGHASDEKILAAAVKTGLDKVIQAHPKGLDLSISEGGRGLSGGQRQLVGLTRLLLLKPAVVLLDEPTASMDAGTQKQVMDALLNDFPKETPIIFITHKTALLPMVSRIIVVDKGGIVLDGDSKEIMEKLYQHIGGKPS